MCLSLLLPVAGCGGCRGDGKTEAQREAERRAKEEEERKPDFEIGALVAQPLDQSSEKAKSVLCFYKPGHWTTTLLPIKANKEDFLGELNLTAMRRVDSATETREPVPLPGVACTMNQSRAVALAKGGPKFAQGYLFVPPTQEQASVQVTLSGRGGGRVRVELPTLLSRMPAHQYHLAVLARNPNRYQYLKSLDSIRPPTDSMVNRLEQMHYQVSLLKADSRVLLPSAALYWTSIAYVLWDDVDPHVLDVDQREALVDWLHWGGQLIVSGPDTLDTLRGSFLADDLPATSGGVWTLAQADFDELNGRFVLPGQPKLRPTGEWTGVKLVLARDAQFVPGTGRLLAERRVGRGRIVVSALRLSDRNLTTWSGFDGWLNACLLRRPPRRYTPNQYGDLELAWADGSDRFDAARTSGLRFFSRDTKVHPKQYTGGFLQEEPPPAPMVPYGYGVAPDPSEIVDKHAGSGVAAWSDFGPVPNAAREVLRDAASVEVPGRWFVIWVVAAYLVVLVPLNWLVFTALGRVEWAWVAAPLIAIAYTVLVIRLAQLDIGFARSETHVGVLELQPGYARAHLTRYSALYTSLTTYYDVEHDDPGAIAQPFSELDAPSQFRVFAGQRFSQLHYEHDQEPRLAGLLVASNSTDSVHTEQMVSLEGRLELMRDSRGYWQVLNRTGLALAGVGLLGRDESGRLETAWIGPLAGLGSQRVELLPAKTKSSPWWPDQRDQDPVTAVVPIKGLCNLRKLVDLAEDASDLRPGEVRLIGWTDQTPPGVRIRPAAPQSQVALLVVAHLRYAHHNAPRPDANARAQVEKLKPLQPEDFSDDSASTPRALGTP